MSTERTTSDCPRCEAPVFLGAEYEMIGTEPAHRICAAKHREETKETKPQPIGSLAIAKMDAFLRDIFPDSPIIDEPRMERTGAGRKSLTDSHEGAA